MNRIWTTFLTEALGPNRHIRRMWHNGQRGRLVVVDGNGLFALNDPTTLYEVFFLEDEPDSLFGGRVRVAEGFVGCLLSMLNRNSEDIYSHYYTFRKALYCTEHLRDADAWERDLTTEFVNAHAEAERRRMEASWPLMELLMEEDAKQMRAFADNYLRFSRPLRFQANPVNPPLETFFPSLFTGGDYGEGLSSSSLTLIRCKTSGGFLFGLQSGSTYWHIKSTP